MLGQPLFLGKPPGGSSPVLSAHSFASTRQLALLESAEEGNIFPQKNVLHAGFHLRSTAYKVDMLLTKLPTSCATEMGQTHLEPA